ncbi:MAG: CPBP family intramembrane metalloprotease [Opitutus sp.]|nr:CPBP family intramembrane metalloprotease [Opitutus sp.]
MLLLLLAGMTYIAKLWRDDYRATAANGGVPPPRALPGTTPASRLAIIVAVLGALGLLALETVGEYALGIVEAQSRITVLFGFYTLAAAFGEELIFRGFIVVPNRGRAALVASCVGASLVFAALHPFLWEWKDGTLTWRFDAKAGLSFGMVFAASLWFYTVRFWKLNPTHSLLPCIAAHAAKNLGVFAIKYVQGFVSDWW